MPKDHFYKWSIVIHNINPDKMDLVKNYEKSKTKEYICSAEPYPEEIEKYHLHLYIEYISQRSKSATIKSMQQLSRKIQMPRPPGELRDWGRVDVKVMQGEFHHADSYLKGETKDKPTGEITHEKRKECKRMWRYIKKYTQMEEFCNLCKKTDCMGCCPSCLLCDPTTYFPNNEDEVRYWEQEYERLGILNGLKRKEVITYNHKNAIHQKTNNLQKEDVQEEALQET